MELVILFSDSLRQSLTEDTIIISLTLSAVAANACISIGVNAQLEQTLTLGPSEVITDSPIVAMQLTGKQMEIFSIGMQRVRVPPIKSNVNIVQRPSVIGPPRLGAHINKSLDEPLLAKPLDPKYTSR